MAREAIEEYLGVAHYCIETKKANQGIYGYPAALLLFSLIDVFSNYAGYQEHSFLVLKDMFPDLSEQQAKKLGKWFRHPPAHQAIIMPGTKMSADDDGEDAIELNELGEPTHIRLTRLYQALEGYWKTLRNEDIKPTFISEAAPRKKEIYGSFSSPTVTGGIVTSTIKPNTK
jgi:hypothetical protein